MKFRAAAKERSSLLLAAVCLLSALVLSPAAEASRSQPAATAPVLEAPATPDQVLSAEFEDPPQRLRLFDDLLLPPRPLELVEARKTASGSSTYTLGLNVWQTGDLSQECSGLSFQGLWTDPVTGIAYARNRWYDARTASWLSEDPMGAVDSPNLYAFVGWQPHAATDPMGLCQGNPQFCRFLWWTKSEGAAEDIEELAVDVAVAVAKEGAATVVEEVSPVGIANGASGLFLGYDFVRDEPVEGFVGRGLAGFSALPAVPAFIRKADNIPGIGWASKKADDLGDFTDDDWDDFLPETRHNLDGPEEAAVHTVRKAQTSYEAGEQLGREYVGRNLGLQEKNWVNPFEHQGSHGQGFDEVMEDAAGDLWIVEYKGGSGELAEGQMSLAWVQKNIERLTKAESPWGTRLQDALDDGRLRGIAVSTPNNASGVGATTEIGRWDYGLD